MPYSSQSVRRLGPLLTAAALLSACYAGHVAEGPSSGPEDGPGGPPGRRDAGRPSTEADAGPGGDDASSGAPGCGDVRRSPLVYYGTREPTYLPLTPEQILAIGTFPGSCTGTVVAPRWVASALHCGVAAGDAFCVGRDPASPDVCFSVTEVLEAPGGNDLVLARLDGDATVALPGLEPIPWMTDRMDRTWVGRTAEAAGYGQQEDGSSGEREFTAEPIVAVSDPFVTIDGEGRRGVCFGDSGGPLMVVADDGSVRVAGVLSYGDGSCVGRDNFTRLDLFADWIASVLGPPAVEGAPCGASLTEEGRCLDGQAVWCEAGRRRSERCAVRCGWSPAAEGFRCIEGDDPCGGVDGFGRCDGHTARWCEAGTPRARNCAACGERCVLDPDAGGATCAPDPCMGLDYLGRCNGDVAEYCRDGSFASRDCGAEGLRCDWVNDEIGYWCTR